MEEKIEARTTTTYWDYIRVDELLALQGGLSPKEEDLSNDEVMFITVHQVFELWFKLILREFGSIRDLLASERVAEGELSEAVRGLRRVSTLLGRCADHFLVMETLPTRAYLEFRDKLFPASGFQSAHMRQIEILMGLETGDRAGLKGGPSFLDVLRTETGEDSPSLARVKAQLADGPSLRESLEDWLFRTPIGGVGPDEEGASASLDAFVGDYLAAHVRQLERAQGFARAPGHGEPGGDTGPLPEAYEKERRSLAAFLSPPEEEGGVRRRRIRAAILFITTYRDLPLLAWPRELLDGFVEMEQAFVIFRQRHARMVERIIGRRTGTGGSSGVEYLEKTGEYRVFLDLWACRTHQLAKSAAPAPENPAYYGFASE